MEKHKTTAFGRSKGQKLNKSHYCKFTTIIILLVLVSLAIIMLAFHFQRRSNGILGLGESETTPQFVLSLKPTTKPILVPTTVSITTVSKPYIEKLSIIPVKLKGGNKPTRKKTTKSPSDYVKNIDSDWGFRGEHKYITVLPTLKIDIKKDRRVIFPNLTMTLPVRPNEPSTGILGSPKELLKANEILKRHPMHDLQHSNKELSDVMIYIKHSEQCTDQPLYLTMATVHDDLYWQLIENFVYTMVKFNISDCSIVICVSDPKCMRLCEEAHFPCFDYVERSLPLPSVMEQIAAVKLLHVPMALTRGVDVFMLDLDVGFLEDPRHMVTAFRETPIVDIMVQEDYIFIMNRTKAGWKTWFTEPLPNIGLFLCRGNNKTARVFELAWGRYQLLQDAQEKSKPGIDQNFVLDAMRVGRGNFGMKYAYFAMTTTPLMDKLVLKQGNVMELGGELMASFLHTQKSVAMHTTCYEKSTKVMGLKATNSFWNPRYYDPLRPTLTKQILFTDEAQLLDEVRSLVWLAISTGRSLIVPNILGRENMKTIAPYRKQIMWPGFRVIYMKREKGRDQLKVVILEPAYYWRVERDYDPVPTPHVVHFDHQRDSILDIKRRMLTEAHKGYSRVVLHPLSEQLQSVSSSDTSALSADSIVGAIERAVSLWANDSVGLYPEPWSKLVRTYSPIPSLNTVRGDALARDVVQGMRTCANIFGASLGNRTCFQICE